MRISIITVTYNAEATIERTLRSVERQSRADLIEHIIMDGASKDATVAMANAYKERVGYAVTVVSEADRGLYDAMNKALRLASGDYVVFLNAGDKLHDEEVVRRVAEVAEESGAGVIYGDTAIVDEQGKFMQLRRLRPPRLLNWRSFREGMLVCHQAFYVSRSIAQEYDLAYRFSADFDWCVRCMKEGERQGKANVAVRNGDGIGVLADYLSEGMTTANHKASLKERFRIMARHYGLAVTVAMHIWFVFRKPHPASPQGEELRS